MVVKDCRVVEAKQRLKAESEQGALSSGTLVFDQMPGSPLLSADTSRPPLQRDWGSAAHHKLCARPCVWCTPTPTHRSCLRRSFSWILGSGCPGSQVVEMVGWSQWPVSKITLNASFALGLDC